MKPRDQWTQAEIDAWDQFAQKHGLRSWADVMDRIFPSRFTQLKASIIVPIFLMLLTAYSIVKTMLKELVT